MEKAIPTTAAELEQALKKRAIEFSKAEPKTYAASVTTCLCAYLATYLERNKDKLSYTRIEGDELTGLIIRAFDDLATQANDLAVKFVKKYEKLVKEYHEDEQDEKLPLFTKVESGWSELSDILFAAKLVFQLVFNGNSPVDFATLESEQKVISLRFQRLLNKIWPTIKERIAKGGIPCLGIFGHSKLMVFQGERYNVFIVADLYNNDANIRFQVSNKTEAAYGAKMVGCRVDLIPALQMLEEISDGFDAGDLRPEQN